MIEISGLRKTFRSLRRSPQCAVDSLTVSIAEGGVFGLIGPNGSGKTTTLRAMLGLLRPDSGQIHIFGRAVPRALPSILPEVGSLIEGPLSFPTSSGRRNLEILARLERLPAQRVDEVLRTVDLIDRQHDLVKSYSLGMRQRLGIAAALLKRPRLLVLDEPGNGLDPAGMAEIRNLVVALAASGDTTVLLSTHLLSEVEQTCERVAILNRGSLVAEGAVQGLLSSQQVDGLVRLRVPVAVAPQAAARLSSAGLGVEVRGAELFVTGSTVGGLARQLADADLELLEIAEVRPSLEQVFLRLTRQGES